MKFHVFFVCCLFPFYSYGQLGGKTTFSFLNFAKYARVVALGGVNITSSDSLASHTFVSNPALLSSTTNRFLSAAYHAHYAGISNSSIAYTHTFDKWGTWGLQVQFLSYGNMQGYDATGKPTSRFSAQDYMLGISHAKQIGIYKLGVSLKFAGSNLHTYSASGVFLDLGGTFEHPHKDLRIGLLFKNLGVSLSNYTAQSEFRMPFDLQMGLSFKPEKMPLRLSITAHRLASKGIAFHDTSTPNPNGQTSHKTITGTDKLLRHFVLGTELLLNRYINLRLGYNFLTRKEMSLPQRKALTGFSFGMMLRINSFEVAYARSIQHISGGINNFMVRVDTNTFSKRKKVVN